MTLAAVFFPCRKIPEDFDLTRIAFQAQRAGLVLCQEAGSNDRFALLSAPPRGWVKVDPLSHLEVTPCAA